MKHASISIGTYIQTSRRCLGYGHIQQCENNIAWLIPVLKKAGAGEIVLKYWHHREGDSSVAARFRIQPHVRPQPSRTSDHDL